MSELRTFRALRFAGDPQPRIAPPYDVISEAERTELASEPQNIVHLTLPAGPEGERDYAAAKRTLESWIRDGVLARDPCEQLYVLEERISNGRTRRGFLGALRLADYRERVVLPHERTMPGPKLDRLRLTRAVRANLEPLFFLYEDRDAKLSALLQGMDHRAPLVACRGGDGTELRLWGLVDPTALEQVRMFLADRAVIIADGHHRYETMLRYRDERREEIERMAGRVAKDEPHEFVLAYLVNAFDPGSEVRAIHRVLSGEVGDLEATLRRAGFEWRESREARSAEVWLERLRERCAQEHAFVFARPDGRTLLALRPRGSRLDVEVLHDELLPALGAELSFDARPVRLLERVVREEVALGILLNPVDPDSLFRVVGEGAVLPQKSTFFSPKIPSGLVLRELG